LNSEVSKRAGGKRMSEGAETEWWSIGVLEYWSIGVLEAGRKQTPNIQHPTSNNGLRYLNLTLSLSLARFIQKAEVGGQK
jgi:hypothetical protein